jgi:cullin 1
VELYKALVCGDVLSSSLTPITVKLGSINKNKPLEIYKEDFEMPFLSNTREYYARESSSFIAANGVSSYMKKAEQRLDEESIRAKKFLDPSSHDKLKKECDMVLIDKHKEIMQVECENYLRDDKREGDIISYLKSLINPLDLTRMYHLLSRIDDGIKPMLEVLQNYVSHTGFEAIKAIPAKDVKEPKKYIETLLQVYEQFSDVVKKAFVNDANFVAALDKVCK